MSTDLNTSINFFEKNRQGRLDEILEAKRNLSDAQKRLEAFAAGGGFTAKDGSTIVLSQGSEELKERVEELTQELREAEAAAAKASLAADSIAVPVINAVKMASTIDLPSNDDWQRAANIRVVMESQLMSASLQRLVNELQGAALSGDPAKQYVVASLALERIPGIKVTDDLRVLELGPKIQNLADSMLGELRPESLKVAVQSAKELIKASSDLEVLVHQGRRKRGEGGGYEYRPKSKTVKVAC